MKKRFVWLLATIAIMFSALAISLGTAPSKAQAAYGDSTNIAEGWNGGARWWVDSDYHMWVDSGDNATGGRMSRSWGSYFAGTNYYRRAFYDVKAITVMGGVKPPTGMGSQQMFWEFEAVETIDLSGMDLSDLTRMDQWFRGCRQLKEIDFGDNTLSNVVSIISAFNGCGSLQSLDLTQFDFSHVTEAGAAFEYCTSLTELDLSAFEGAPLASMGAMFEGCSGLTELDLSPLDTSRVTGMTNLFKGCTGLTSIDLSPLETTNATSMEGMFQNCSGLTELDLTPLNTSNVHSMANMFNGCSGLTEIDLSPLDTGSVNHTEFMFANCTGLTSIDLSPLDTSSVYDMHYMFAYSGFETLDLTPLDCSAVENMSGAFYSCGSLTSINLTDIDTSSATNMSNLFAGCYSLPAIDVSQLDTHNVTTMDEMFAGTTALKAVDLASMDTSNVTSMDGMFGLSDANGYGGQTLYERHEAGIVFADFSHNNLANLESMIYMFNGCTSLTGCNFNDVDTSKVGYMQAMFQGCTGLVELDLTGLDTQNVTNMTDMFRNCENLERVDLSGFNTSRVSSFTTMFAGCTSLEELDLSSFDMRQGPYCTDMMMDLASIKKVTVGENYDVSRWLSFPYPGNGEYWFSEKDQKWYSAYYIWNNRKGIADTYTTAEVEPGTPRGGQAMYRLYNKWTGEHFYTANKSERDGLVSAGWTYEGIGWFAPTTSHHPVYRLYNKWVPGGDHHYTMDAAERDTLVEAGWTYENVGWYSDDWERVPLYRQYNPYASTGTHNYTTSIEENDHLVSVGWLAEGIGWYGMDDTKPSLVVSRVVIEDIDTSFAPETRPSFAEHTSTSDEQSKHAHITEELWYGYNSDYSVYNTMAHDNDEVAIAGLTYTYYLTITLDQGATFAPTLTYVIDGQEYTVDASYATYSNGVWSIHVWSDCKITCNAPASLVVTGVNDTLPEGTMPQPTAAIDPSCEFADEVSIYGESWLYETQEGEELLSRISMVAAFPAQGTECSYVLSLKLADGFTLPDTFELMVNGVACTGTVQTQLGYLPSMEGIVHVVTTYTTTVGAPVGSTDPVTLESLSIEGVATQLLSSTMPTFGASVTATTPEGAPVEVIDEAWGTLIVPSEGTSGGYSLMPLAAEPNIAWMGTYAPEVGSTLHYAFIVSLPDGSQISPDLTVNINGQPCTVLGVLSQTNSGPRDTATIFVDYSFVVQEG